MNFKKIVAFTIATTMVLGSSLTAFATEATTDIETGTAATSGKELIGTGSEAFVNKNVLKVTVPTDVSKVFDYKVDPQGLIAETGSFAGTAVTGDATGVVFKNTGDKISNESDPVVVTNKSSTAVEMAITLKLTAASDGLATSVMADSDDFTTTANASKALYLGVKATNDSERAMGASDVTVGNILLSGEDQYEAKWATDKYVYEEKSDAKFDDFEFTVVGAINKSLAPTTWATVADNGTVTVKNPPAISVKFTLTQVKDALPAGVAFVGDDLYVWNANAADLNVDGGLGTTAPTAVTVNGKSVTVSDFQLVAGYGLITFDKIAPLFTSKAVDDLTAEEKTQIKNYVKAVKATFASATFYGEIAE